MNPTTVRHWDHTIRLVLLVLVLLVSLYAAAAIAPRAPTRIENETAVPESYFGLHIHRAVPTARFPEISAWPDVGFVGWRLWDSSVSWPSLEPSKGQWSFGTLDSCVALAEAQHAEILLPLGLSPPWASSRPEEPCAYAPGNAAPPRDLEDWRNYVRTVATRYKGRIHQYEIWNEPNLARFFSGSAEEMLSLAREAFTILKTVDPDNVVVSPSATSGEAGVTWLQAYLGLGGGAACDVVGFHFYTGGKAPETIRRLAVRARRAMKSAGVAVKPLWNTETGWNIPSQLPTAGTTPNAQQQTILASYVSRAMVAAWAGGVTRFYWYAWDNFKMGLTESDGKTEKPAALAFRVTRRWLVGKRMSDWCYSSTGVYSVTLTGPDGGRSWLVWTAGGPTLFRIPSEWRVARVEDLTGTARTLSQVTRTRRLPVGQTPLLLAGAP